MGLLKIKCEYCGKIIRKKGAYFSKIKRLEFVFSKKTGFCSRKCCKKYRNYEANLVKKPKLCSSCPMPPALLEDKKLN